MNKDTDIARKAFIEKINETKSMLNECKPNTPHYRDLQKHYRKLRKQLYLYDSRMRG